MQGKEQEGMEAQEVEPAATSKAGKILLGTRNPSWELFRLMEISYLEDNDTVFATL